MHYHYALKGNFYFQTAIMCELISHVKKIILKVNVNVKKIILKVNINVKKINVNDFFTKINFTDKLT